MSIYVKHRQPLTLLKTSFNVLVSHPIILVPLIVAALIHIFILEILYFAPRFPLSILFAPLIRQSAGEMFLHYPYNFILMARWYYTLQVPLYILFNSYFLAVSVVIIQIINNDQGVDIQSIYQRVFRRYGHIFLAALLSIGALVFCNHAYLALIRELLAAPLVGRMGERMNWLIISLLPYLSLLLAVVITTLFAFVIPVIVLENKGIWDALRENFRIIRKSFWFVFSVLFLPYLLYIPFLLLRMDTTILDLLRIPDAMIIVLGVAVCAMLIVEAIQYTAITLYYLLWKETT